MTTINGFEKKLMLDGVKESELKPIAVRIDDLGGGIEPIFGVMSRGVFQRLSSDDRAQEVCAKSTDGFTAISLADMVPHSMESDFEKQIRLGQEKMSRRSAVIAIETAVGIASSVSSTSKTTSELRALLKAVKAWDRDAGAGEMPNHALDFFASWRLALEESPDWPVVYD